MVKIRAAGTLFYCLKTGRVLLGRRAQNSSEPGHWACFGGKIEPREMPRQAAFREMVEETGYSEEDPGKLWYVSNNGKCRFFCYIKPVQAEFTLPKLDTTENDRYGWFSLDKLPRPILPAMAKYLHAERIETYL